MLPVLRGERLEAAESRERRGVSVIGSGLSWPPVARFDLAEGVGRLPAAYAWMMLHAPDSEWRWLRAGGPYSARPAEAIAAIVADSVLRTPRKSLPTAVVVPNTIGLTAQDRLLGALRWLDLDAKLLWRPVAAALRWIEEQGQQYGALARQTNVSFGRVAAVHLGLDGFEADVLDLVPWTSRDGRIWVLPARKRPSIRSQVGWAMTQAERAASQGTSVAEAWRRLWGGPWNLSLLQGAVAGGLAELTQWRVGLGIDSNSLREREPLFTDAEPRSWLEGVMNAARGNLPLLGVVVTGELANAAHIDGVPSVVAALKSHHPRAVVMVGTAERPGRLLAEGAALFLERHLKEEPTYLDTLPLIETIVMQQGEPKWQPLVDEQRPYVMGGRVHKYEPERQRFTLRADDPSITLAVAQEGHETVREVKEELRAVRDHDMPVRLSIEIAAGQGNPRVEVRASLHGDLLGQRLYLDWDRAIDTELSREQALEVVPRTHPPLEPRRASLNCWNGGGGPVHWQQNVLGVRQSLERVLEMLSSPWSEVLAQRFESLREALRTADDGMKRGNPPVHATAFDSDGRAHSLADLSLIEAFVQRCDELLTPHSNKSLRCEVLRCLGYMSATSSTLLDYARQHFRLLANGQVGEERDPLLNVCGNCLRDPEDIGVFADAAAAKFDDSLAAAAPWLRALCRVLRYRADATENIESSTCEKLAMFSFQIAKRQIDEQHEAKYLYRYGTLCIAYLLRRRRYDDGYMDPAAPQTELIKSFMLNAAEGIRRGNIEAIRGVVDVAHTSQLIVDFIDKRGQGRLVAMDD